MSYRVPTLPALTAALIAFSAPAFAQSPDDAPFDFMTTKFEELQMAARISESVRIAQGSFVATAILSNIEGETVREEELELVQSDPEGLAAFEREVGPAAEGRGPAVFLRLSPAAIATLEDFRRQIEEAKKAGRKGAFSIDVQSNQLCRVQGEPMDELRVDIYLKTSESGRFFPMAQDVDMRVIFDELPDFPEGLELCPAGG